MRRTVMERVMPPPRRRITVPSKTWTRSRLPSTTLADTLTVSPDASSGRSVRSWSETISSRTVTGIPWSRSGGHGRLGRRRRIAYRSADLALALDLLDQALLGRAGWALDEQVRTALERPPQRFLL